MVNSRSPRTTFARADHAGNWCDQNQYLVKLPSSGRYSSVCFTCSVLKMAPQKSSTDGMCDSVRKTSAMKNSFCCSSDHMVFASDSDSWWTEAEPLGMYVRIYEITNRNCYQAEHLKLPK